MFGSFTADKELGSMAFFGIDNKRAYYLFGANDPELRDTHTGTAVLWDAFKILNQSGIKEVDILVLEDGGDVFTIRRYNH